MEEVIKIERTRNGYVVESHEFNENSGEYEDNTYVFQEKACESFNPSMNRTEEEVETFQEVVKFLEMRLGLDIVNKGDYYLHYEIRKREND